MDNLNQQNRDLPNQHADGKVMEPYPTPVDVVSKLRAKEKIGPLDQQIIFRHLSRKWRRYCSPPEWALLSYIFDRSIGWGHPTFSACQANIINGDAEYAGCGLKKTALNSTLNSLKERQMITRERKRDFIILGLNLEHPDMKIPVSKRLQSDQKSAKRTSRSPAGELEKSAKRTQNSRVGNSRVYTSSPSAQMDILLDEFENQFGPEKSEIEPEISAENSDENFAAENIETDNRGGMKSATDAVQAKLDLVSAKRETETQRKASAAKRKSKNRLNTNDLELVWKTAMAETFPEKMHIGWSVDQRKQYKGFIQQFNSKVNGDLLAFAEWSVKNWRAVLLRNPWMKQPPEFPNFGWWRSTGIQSVFSETRALIEENKYSNPNTASRMEHLMRSGLTEEEAHLELAKDHAHGALKKEMRQSEARQRTDRFAAEKARDEARQMDRFKGKLDEALGSDDETAKELAGLIREDSNGNVVVPHPRSPRMEAYRKKKRDEKAAQAIQAAKQSGMASAPVPTETWEEMQERLRKETAAKFNRVQALHTENPYEMTLFPVLTETWEEVQERLRKETAGQFGNANKNNKKVAL